MKKLWWLVLALTLTACGGGSDAPEVPAVNTRPLVIFDGDSMADWNFPDTKWPRLVEAAFPQADFVNVAVRSSRVAVEVKERFESTVVPLMRARGHGVYMLSGGTNDVRRGVSNYDTKPTLEYIWARARKEGFKVVVVTVGPLSGQWVQYEEVRQDLNLFIRMGDREPKWHGLVDWGAMFSRADTANLDLFSDELHFGPVGNQMVADRTIEIFNGLLP
jgi:hypothetical protein